MLKVFIYRLYLTTKIKTFLSHNLHTIEILMRKFLMLFCFIAAAIASPGREKQKITDRLEILPLSEHAIVHITYLQTETYGRVACNGLIYINNNEAVIMDTPSDDSSAEDLLQWFAATYPHAAIKAVIINHFHKDCLTSYRRWCQNNFDR